MNRLSFTGDGIELMDSAIFVAWMIFWVTSRRPLVTTGVWVRAGVAAARSPAKIAHLNCILRIVLEGMNLMSKVITGDYFRWVFYYLYSQSVSQFPPGRRDKNFIQA